MDLCNGACSFNIVNFRIYAGYIRPRTIIIQDRLIRLDMASASSVITDSAAASSSWGGGVRVKNGRLNIGDNGEEYMPVWQKFKKAGKKVGCVTTVPITHATPAGFCVSSKSRGEQSDIAAKYLDIRFDVMMGGGGKYFNQKEKNRLNFRIAIGFTFVISIILLQILSFNK